MKILLFLLLGGSLWGAPTWIPKGAEIPKGLVKKIAFDTGSMRPAIRGDTIFYGELYVGQKLSVGDWVEFQRACDGAMVLHEITALNERAIYTSGLSCRYSDGWTPKQNIISICRFVERH